MAPIHKAALTGIDDEQDDDDCEASERRPGKVGGIQPSAAIGQARQQQRYADPAFGEGQDEGKRRDRQGRQQVGLGNDERDAEEGDHGANAADRKPRCVTREFGAHPVGSVTIGLAIDLHRAAGQAEHRQRNGDEGKVIIEHDAEEAGDEDLIGQSSRRQQED